eukprot:scaffold814_cov100-Cylindrotheca_fusiformis.AAC.3
MVWTINKALVVIAVLLFTATTVCFISYKLGEKQEQQRKSKNNKNRHDELIEQQQRRHLSSSSSSSLVLYGSDPRFRLRQCEGDCDRDSDCEGNDDDLVCFQRGGPYEPVPGCLGGETDGTLSDYCVHINDLTLPRLSWSLTFPLQQCQGDCDYDSDCQDNLICFQRNELIPIPSCLGNDWSRTDYCILPPPPPPRRRRIGFPLWPFQDTASLPTTSSPRPPTLRPTNRPQQPTPSPSPSQPTPTRPTITKTTSPPIPSPTSPPPNNNNDNQQNDNTILRFGTTFPLGHCEGDCDANQDCQDGMMTFRMTYCRIIEGTIVSSPMFESNYIGNVDILGKKKPLNENGAYSVWVMVVVFVENIEDYTFIHVNHHLNILILYLNGETIISSSYMMMTYVYNVNIPPAIRFIPLHVMVVMNCNCGLHEISISMAMAIITTTRTLPDPVLKSVLWETKIYV